MQLPPDHEHTPYRTYTDTFGNFMFYCKCGALVDRYGVEIDTQTGFDVWDDVVTPLVGLLFVLGLTAVLVIAIFLLRQWLWG